MTTNLNTPEGAWDSESRLSPYCTVWSPEQDDDDEWQRLYDEHFATYGQADLATEYADAYSG